MSLVRSEHVTVPFFINECVDNEQTHSYGSNNRESILLLVTVLNQ